MGFQIQLATVGYGVYQETGKVLDLGWVGLAQFLPVLLLALVAGQVADRADRRAVMSAGYFVLAAVCGLFAGASAWGTVTTGVVVVLGLMIGTARAFVNPAGAALLPTIVGKEALPQALAVATTLWQLTTIVGPGLGGLIIAATGGPVVAFVVAGALQLGAAALVWTLPGSRPPPQASSWADLTLGLRYVYEKKLLWACITLDLFAVLLGGATALLPVMAEDELGLGPIGYGALRAAPSVGAVAMALWLSRHPVERGAGKQMLGAVAVFGICTVVFGLAPWGWVAGLALVTLGAADMISVVVRQIVVQLGTPDELRGRVGAVQQVFVGASNELGEFESGVAASALGVRPAIVFGGLGTLAVVALWSRMFPELREADRIRPPA